MKNFSIAVLLILACTGFVLSQGKAARPRFGSVYSNLTTNCRNWAGEGGSDGYSICRGPGGYRIRVYYSAASVHYNAEIAKDETSNFPIAMLAIGFDDRKTRLEWRTANGKPFAVIMRTPTYADPIKEGEYYGPKNGETLVIKGLKGVDLDTSVAAKGLDANKTAREMADMAYLKTLHKD
jgi:hypothetical protein